MVAGVVAVAEEAPELVELEVGAEEALEAVELVAATAEAGAVATAAARVTVVEWAMALASVSVTPTLTPRFRLMALDLPDKKEQITTGEASRPITDEA
jgi:hypothetical protein